VTKRDLVHEFSNLDLIDTQFGETASDDWFADFNDDGLAEMMIGRLPARTAHETAAMAGNPSLDVLLVADRNDRFNSGGKNES